MLVYLKKKVSELDGPKWAALFLFEFVVVLLGVLCAQMLQERFEDRREKARFESTRLLIDAQARSVAEAVIVRALQKDCVRGNMRKILASIEARQPADFGLIVNHPARSAPKFDVWSGDVPSLARKYLDPEELTFYEYIATLNDLLNRELSQEEPLWAHLQLVREGGANLSEVERLTAKQSIFEIEHFYQAYGAANEMLLPSFVALDLVPDPDRIIALHRDGMPCSAEVKQGVAEFRSRLKALAAKKAD